MKFLARATFHDDCIMKVAKSGDGIYSLSKDGELFISKFENNELGVKKNFSLRKFKECAVSLLVDELKDNRIIYVGDNYGDIKCLYLNKNGIKNLGQLEGHCDSIMGLDTIKTNKTRLLLSCSYEGTVRIWNISTKKCLRELSMTYLNPVNSVKSLEANPHQFFCSFSSNIQQWDYIKGAAIMKEKPHEGIITNIVIQEEMNILASASWDGTIKLFDLRNLKLIDKFLPMGFRPHSIDLCNPLLISGTTDGWINIWDVRSMKHLDYFQGHQECIESINFSGPLNFITGSRDTSLKYWMIKERLLNYHEFVIESDSD